MSLFLFLSSVSLGATLLVKVCQNQGIQKKYEKGEWSYRGLQTCILWYWLWYWEAERVQAYSNPELLGKPKLEGEPQTPLHKCKQPYQSIKVNILLCLMKTYNNSYLNGINFGEDLIWQIEKIAQFGGDLFWQITQRDKFFNVLQRFFKMKTKKI